MFWKSAEERAAEEKVEREEQQRQDDIAEHNRGQSEGASASMTDRVIHNTVGFMVHTEKYNDGWDNATKDRYPV
jgi:hypothetical protein